MKGMLVRTWALALVSILVVGMVPALGQGEGPPQSPLTSFRQDALQKCCYGGDLRLRFVNFDNIPLNADPPGVTRGGENSFIRMRTRLFGQYDPADNVTIRLRAVNEFRYYDKPDNETWDFLDEIVFDTAYFDVRDMVDGKLDMRIGRQDMIYGTGKVILEGTPKDGSRTIYFNAAKFTWKGVEDWKIDAFGIYNDTEDDLAINSEDRDLVGLAAGYNDMTESGAGVYAMHRPADGVPADVYYIYKEESDWDRTVAGEEGPMQVTIPKVQVNTLGVRVAPKVAEGLMANVEFAYQFGEQGDDDVEGAMADAWVKWDADPDSAYKPAVGLGFYYLTGDDPDTGKDEGWNPLWARYPQYSELYVYAFDADGAGRWSNVAMPHLDLVGQCLEGKVKGRAMIGYMSAPEEDGPGGGSERGWIGTFRADFALAEKLLSDSDKLGGHFTIEGLEPGDYYNVDDTAYFARFELSYAF